MIRLGCSIYPEHSSIAEIKAYLDRLSKLNVQRIFSCLLSVEKEPAIIVQEFKEFIAYAHQLGMEVIVDVSPAVFERLNISYDDLQFFHDLGADGIRLDEGFDGIKEAMMTHNPYGLKIEINASSADKLLTNIMNFDPNKDKLIACHNFYPQRYSGISFEHFEKTSKYMKEHGVHLAAFIGSQNDGAFGPWPLKEGLCTLEMHRELPIDLQLRHLMASNLVDDVLIANCYPSEEELLNIEKSMRDALMFKLVEEVELSTVEQAILYNYDHVVRGDVSAYMLRSTQPRITYADADIPAKNTRDLHAGDVVIVNNEYGRYKGELQLCLKDMPNDGNKNVVAHLADAEEILLPYLTSWKHFGFFK